METLYPLFEGLPQPISRGVECLEVLNECSVIGVISIEDSCVNEVINGSRRAFYLEDMKGRIMIYGDCLDSILDGLVLFVYGYLDFKHNFCVKSLHFPKIIESIEYPVVNSYIIAIFSDIALISPGFDAKYLDKMINIANSSDLSIFLGNVLSNNDFPSFLGNSDLDWKMWLEIIDVSSIDKISSFFGSISKSSMIIPGFGDPVPSTLPQKSLIAELFPKQSLLFATNPCSFSISDMNLLCSSGDQILDILSYCTFTYIQVQELLIKYRHIAPNSPHRIPYSSTFDTDSLCIKDLPHIFLCGMAPSFDISRKYGVYNISVPSFRKSKSYVIADLSSMSFHVNNVYD